VVVEQFAAMVKTDVYPFSGVGRHLRHCNAHRVCFDFRCAVRATETAAAARRRFGESV
jgi:hypothetical protein